MSDNENAKQKGLPTDHGQNLSSSYVDYIRSRRQELAGTVTGALVAMGLMHEKSPSSTDEKPVTPTMPKGPAPSEASTATAPARRKGLTRELSRLDLQVITMHGKVIERVNPGGLAAKVLNQHRQDSHPVDVVAQGFPTRIDYPDKTLRKLTYDAVGNVIAILDRDGSTWKFESGSLWVQFQAGGRPTGDVWEGTVTITSQGDLTFEDAGDGSLVTEMADGSKLLQDAGGCKIQVNSLGQVSSVVYSDGQMRSFGYADDGTLAMVVEKDGTTVCKAAGKSWEIRDAKDTVLARIGSGSASVDELGTYIFIDDDTGKKVTETISGQVVTELSGGYAILQESDGTRCVVCSDGTKLRTLPDGTIATETPTGTIAQRPDGSCLETNEHKRITRIQQPDQKVRELSYDASGAVFAWKDTDDSLWHRVCSDTWLQCTVDGRATGLSIKGSFHVDDAGTAIFQAEEGAVRLELSPTGVAVCQTGSKAVTLSSHTSGFAPLFTRFLGLSAAPLSGGAPPAEAQPIPKSAKRATKERQAAITPEGTNITLNALGQTVCVSYAGGSRRDFAYDGDGLSEVKEDGRVTWKRAGVRAWTDNEGTMYKDLEISVDGAGNFRICDLADDRSTIVRTDGAIVELDGHNQLLVYVSPGKRVFTVTAEGTAEYRIAAGDTGMAIAADAVLLQHWSQVHYRPGEEECNEQLSELEMLNDTMESLQAGQTVMVPFESAEREASSSSLRSENSIALEFDPFGYVRRIEYGDGTSREFHYATNGTVNKIVDHTGNTVVRNDDQTWTSFLRSGKESGSVSACQITVYSDGTMVWDYSDKGTKTLYRPDGSAAQLDSHDRLLQYMSKRDRKFTLNGDSIAEYRVSKADTLDEIAADALRFQKWESAHYQPSDKEIAKESERISRLNGINTKTLTAGLVLSFKVSMG